MNHLFTINAKQYVVRQHSQKIVLLSLPELQPTAKHYINVQYSAVNQHTQQILAIHKNTVIILKPALLPLHLIETQQCFLQWQPVGGIIMSSNVVLFDAHAIVFFVRGTLLEKSWNIDIIQQIEDIKANLNQTNLAMKVKNPSNTIFMWKMDDLNLKPNQEIILNEEILQWQFYGSNVLSILTQSEFRIYCKNAQNEFNLLHFYQFLNNLSFCWIRDFATADESRQSVNTILILDKAGQALLVELYNIEKRTNLSNCKKIAKLELTYKGILMKRAIAGWNDSYSASIICETKNHNLFTFQLNQRLEVVSRNTNEELLGAHIQEAYFKDNIILAKDTTLWKYFRYISNNCFQLLKTINCEKAFIHDDTSYSYLKNQTLFFDRFDVPCEKSHQIKYSNPESVFLIDEENGNSFYLIGIRLFRWNIEKMSSIGLAIKNEKAKLLEVFPFTKSLLYKMGEQHLLMEYMVVNDKIVTKTIKSSSCKCISLKEGKWAELDTFQIRIGAADKVFATFQLSKVLNILGAQDQLCEYALHPIFNHGLALIIKNYVFFLQLIDDENGFEVILLKRLNTILYKRFNAQAQKFSLINPNELVFWIDNSILRLGVKLNYHIAEDPFGLPDTLIKKQIDLKKIYSLHHPKLIHCLIQLNKIGLIMGMLKNIYPWFKKSEKSISQFYQLIGIQFMAKYLDNSNSEDNISNCNQKTLGENAQFLNKFAHQLLEDPENIILKDKNALIFESQMEALSFTFQNSKNIDYFSQSTSIALKTPFLKGKPFESMNIAFLYHSMNKQQMISYIRPEKMDWAWVQNYSVILWYDNMENIKKWIQEIAMNEYRANKDPFNCLFWYILAGKKNILITLFKTHKLDSKEHEAMFTFLQRDFSQPKDRTAAIKNAFVLIDKKRYMHALAFFILGNQPDDCVRIGFDRLKDINLTYLFCLLFKGAKKDYMVGQITRKGDIWMKHIVQKINGKHIDAYNCLFEDEPTQKWEFIPPLAGFHPSVIEFSEKILHSVAVKRQLELQKVSHNQAQDIFSHFYGDYHNASNVQEVQQKTQEKVIVSNHGWHKEQAVRYYLKQGLPILAQLIDPDNQQARCASQLQAYKLTGVIKPSVEEMVIRLEDSIGIVSCYFSKKRIQQLLAYLEKFKQHFEQSFRAISFLDFRPTKKHKIGELIYYSYYVDKIVELMKTNEEISENTIKIQQYIFDLRQLFILGKVYICILLEYYEPLVELLNILSNKCNQYEMEDNFWSRVKEKYNNLHERKKEKLLKLMDHFQHAFIKIKKKEEQIQPRMELKFDPAQGSFIIFKLFIFNFLDKQASLLKKEIRRNKNQLERCSKTWIDEQTYFDIMKQFKMIIKDGSMSLTNQSILKKAFEESFTYFSNVVILCQSNYIEECRLPFKKESDNQQILAIQIFRNKQEGLRNFVINQQDGQGLECIAMFKRVLKKFEICQNLTKRQRSKDGNYLIVEDQVTIIKANIESNDFQRNKCPQNISLALNHIKQAKRSIRTTDPIRNLAPYNENGFSKILDPTPYLDYNELNSIACHPFLPYYFIGGKSVVEVCSISTMKNFNRINCPGMNQIVKIHPSFHRISVSDNAGSLLVYNFDKNYENNCVFSLKKAGVIDFCHLRPSIIAVISTQGVNVYDTLLHSKRQLKFKQTLTKEPTSILSLSEHRIAVLRKNEVLLYDTRIERLESSKDLKGKGRSFVSVGNRLYVGLSDAKVKIFDVTKEDYSQIIKVGGLEDKDREKVSIDQLAVFKDVVIAQNNEGSLFYLPKLP